MKLDRLQYQLDAIQKAVEAIKAENVLINEHFYANPTLQNTRNIDIKMETGTGKTYVYTRLIHELKQRFGFFKFIILVPSVAIKEGTKSSIQSPVWNSHFRQEFANQSINLGVINAGDFSSKKGKRKQIPESLRSFCEGSRSEEKTIQVLLLNDGMLASKSMTANDFDSTLFGSISSPIQGLREARPIVIIDEPHRFNKNNKAWTTITEGLNPQLIIRFGATFPEHTAGKGKLKRTEKDYENLVYDLNAVRAFNEGLVKGVHIVYPAIPNVRNADDMVKFRVKHIHVKDGVTFSNGKRDTTIKIGESLSILDPGFGGITLEVIHSASAAVLSNELELRPNLDLLPNVFGMGYQELLLQQAIDAHFEKEKENFYRPKVNNNPPRIKTNSLFFIDSISSFRGQSDDDDKGWLRLKFETLLTHKLNQELRTATDEYKAFLEASLRDVSGTIAGYFSEDNAKKGDDPIQKEVDDILRNKEQMLRFKNEDGSWNIRRFLFSKWTLREGWDNPNVFVICKLRSSGSEISKIQEVGRGLRLPFDENGNRQSHDTGEDFRLTYIIDFSEREFAQKLVGEINADGGKLEQGIVTDELLDMLVNSGYAEDKNKAFFKLGGEGLVDVNRKILDTEKFFELLPENSGMTINRGIITSEDLPKRPTVKLKKDNFEKLRSLWDEVTKRYALEFEEIDIDTLKNALREVLKGNVFVKPYIEIVSEKTQRSEDGSRISMVREGFQSAESNLGVLTYGEFLKRLNKRTHLPLNILHECIVASRIDEKTPSEFFNLNSLEIIIESFESIFVTLYAQKFAYSALDYHASTSILKRENGTFVFVDELPQGDVGVNIANDISRKDNNYLYDKYVYDSEIEHEVLKVDPPTSVVVYGKLPRRSIKLPTYIGGSTSPDFVYAIQRNHKPLQLHLVVETKSDNMRDSDKVAISSQQKAFKNIHGIEWRKTTKIEDFERDLKALIDEK
ncbi:MAG: type III restriction-modification system endonuclease [Bacteroidia bacterium]|nr:type III restriction-modification system endonuclease [Bacteroidia bacterium]